MASPEPSRLPNSAGRGRATPPAEAPSAGWGPAQASCSSVSPLSSRWARTPAVARPLAGYSARGVFFMEPGTVPGSVSSPAVTVTTTARSPSAAGTAENAMTPSPAATLTPAIPPAVRPCGRTSAAA